MHSALKESVDKCRRTLQKSSPEVANKIKIDLCHVYGLLYLSRVEGNPTCLVENIPSTLPTRSELMKLLSRNPKVAQILFYFLVQPR
mmetsp:Transcript_13576/g.26188  ORF Transcript_13576/g.26188 Transcript_13576/m.26188 type:complete len:87 (-) Transcript_13576:1198-1458(-)